MKGLLITGGKCSEISRIKQYIDDYDIVIAADSGFDNAERLNIKPDVLIGDMDSIESRKNINKYKDIKIIEYPEDKDLTDTELALNYLFDNKYDKITLIGGGGGRLDHIIAILSIFNRDKYPVKWITDNEIVYCFDDEISINGRIGDTISFFPAGKSKCKMKSYGLKWKLDDLVWQTGSVGVSNRFSEETCRVILSSGKLIAVKEL